MCLCVDIWHAASENEPAAEFPFLASAVTSAVVSARVSPRTSERDMATAWRKALETSHWATLEAAGAWAWLWVATASVYMLLLDRAAVLPAVDCLDNRPCVAVVLVLVRVVVARSSGVCRGKEEEEEE